MTQHILIVQSHIFEIIEIKSINAEEKVRVFKKHYGYKSLVAY